MIRLVSTLFGCLALATCVAFALGYSIAGPQVIGMSKWPLVLYSFGMVAALPFHLNEDFLPFLKNASALPGVFLLCGVFTSMGLIGADPIGLGIFKGFAWFAAIFFPALIWLRLGIKFKVMSSPAQAGI